MLILGNVKPSQNEGVREMVKNNFPTDLIAISEFSAFSGEGKEDEVVKSLKDSTIKVMSSVHQFLEQYIKYMGEKVKDINSDSVLALSFIYVLEKEDDEKLDEDCLVSYISPEVKITKNFISCIKNKSFKKHKEIDDFLGQIAQDILLYKKLIIDAPSNMEITEVHIDSYKDFYLSKAERGVLEWI